MKVQCDEAGGRILLGDNTDSGIFKLRPIGFQCFGVWISTVLYFIYIPTLPQVYSLRTRLKFDLHRALVTATTA
jgi:hypothetical protein